MAEGHDGKALCLDYDFNDVSGYAAMQRELPLDYPDNYAFAFQLRGDSPANDLQFKLVDDSGDNVWWVNRTHFEYPKQWTPVRLQEAAHQRAWGPAPDPTLRHSRKVEFTIYNRVGGKGSVCFDELTLRTLPPEDDSPLTGQAAATAQESSAPAANAIDGNLATAWKAPLSAAPQWRLDLRRMREFGGVVLRWLPGLASTSYRIELSDDGRDVAACARSDGQRRRKRLHRAARVRGPLPAPDDAGRRGEFDRAGRVRRAAAGILRHAQRLPQGRRLARRNAARIRAASAASSRTGPSSGIDGGDEQGLIGEDGAIELGKGAFSIEPVVVTRRRHRRLGERRLEAIAAGRLPADPQRGMAARRSAAAGHVLRAGHARAIAAGRPLPPDQPHAGAGRLHADAADAAVAGEPAQPVPQHGRWHQPHPSPAHRRWTRRGRAKAAGWWPSPTPQGSHVTTFDAADAPVQWRGATPSPSTIRPGWPAARCPTPCASGPASRSRPTGSRR